MKFLTLFVALTVFTKGYAQTVNDPVSCPLGRGPVVNYDFQELLAEFLEALGDFISTLYNHTCSGDTLADVTSRLLDAILQFVVALLSLFSAFYNNISKNPIFYKFIISIAKTAASIGSQNSGNPPFSIGSLANAFADVLFSTSGIGKAIGNNKVFGEKTVGDPSISNVGSSNPIINNAGGSGIVTSNAAAAKTATAGSSGIATSAAGSSAGTSGTAFNNPGYYAANPSWYVYPVLPATGTSDNFGTAAGSISTVSAGSSASSAAVSNSNSQSGSIIGPGSNYNGPLAPLSFYDLALQSLQQGGVSNVPVGGLPQPQTYPQLQNAFINNMQGSSSPNINPLTQQTVGVGTSPVSSYPQVPGYAIPGNTFPILNTGGVSGGVATSSVTASSGSGTGQPSSYMYPQNFPQGSNFQFGPSFGG